jgi:hypothetical protein
MSVLHDKCSVESRCIQRMLQSLEVVILHFRCCQTRQDRTPAYSFCHMDKLAGVKSGKQAVVLFIIASETNNLALENIEIPGSSRRQISVRVTGTTLLLPNVDFVS